MSKEVVWIGVAVIMLTAALGVAVDLITPTVATGAILPPLAFWAVIGIFGTSFNRNMSLQAICLGVAVIVAFGGLLLAIGTFSRLQTFVAITTAAILWIILAVASREHSHG